ncbi:MAG: hypothetical protein AAGC56_09945 [Pseudomonadota bacterium]
MPQSHPTPPQSTPPRSTPSTAKGVEDRLNAVFVAATFGEARARVGEILGLDSPAPANVTARVLADPRFGKMIASLGHLPPWRQKFLDDPFNAKFAPPEIEDGAVDAESLPTSMELAKNFASGVLAWGVQGFRSLEPADHERRQAACLSCPRMTPVPTDGMKGALYDLARRVTGAHTEKRTDTHACAACGCLISRKIANPAETCPEPSASDPALSRWMEPLGQA